MFRHVVSLMAVCAFLFAGCGMGKDPVVAKIKGLSIRQSQIDSLFSGIADKTERTKKIREYITAELDKQAQYDQAIAMGFHRQFENKAVLQNIEMIESAGYYANEILKKNWGFTGDQVEKRYRADRELYRKDKPRTDSVPTPEQQKALAEFDKDPYKPLDVVRPKVLRSILMEQPAIKAALQERIKALGENPDSQRIYEAEDALVNDYATTLDSTVMEQLKEQHKVKIHEYLPTVGDAELREFWDKTKQSYKRKPDMDVQFISVADRKLAYDIVDRINKKNEDFLKLQKKYSTDKAALGKTLKISGSEEKVPFIVGDSKQVYPTIMYLPVGKISNPIAIQGGPKEMFYIFKIIARAAEELMSFEEARASAHERALAEKQLKIPNDFVLAEVDNKKITAQDVFSLLYKISPMTAERYRTADGRKALVERYYLRFLLFSLKVRELGLQKEPALVKRINDMRKNFLVSDFKNTYLDVTFGIPEKELKKYYDAHPDSFTVSKKLEPYEKMRNRAVSLVMVSDDMIKDYYSYNIEDYSNNDGSPKPLADVARTIRAELLGMQRKYRMDDLMRSYRKAFGAKVYVKEYAFEEAKKPEQLFEEAKKLHEDRNYAEAKNKYLEIRYKYRDFKNNPDICMALAQIYVEQKNFNKAIGEYRRYLRMFPNDPSKYKAQFMIGFVYSENLNDKEKAIAAYQAVLDNYPSCELAESAKFMIEHLKTGKEFIPLDEDTAAAAKPKS